MESESDEGQSDSNQLLIKLAPQQPQPRRRTQQMKESQPLVKAINLNVIREKKPRLVIDHMVLQDFKSYAGRQIIGKFHGNFTSVVGPNGSGKSNLIESMLFIFGFNASWMRLNKLNQLIHNSSTSTGNAKAAVEVHFKKLQEMSNGALIQVEGFNLWIRRTVNSSSVSKYYLSGRESTQAEVKERLRAEGIDLGNNRFLILQGEVQQISQMKQKSGDTQKPGLLEYLQEIIGSNQFIEKIEQCGREYAQSEQQKHQKGQLMKMVQTELKGMSKAKDEAVKYVKKQKKIYQIQNIFNQVLVTLTKQQSKRLKQQLVELQKTRDRIMAEERQKLRKQGERLKEIKRNKAELEQNQKQNQKYQQLTTKLQGQDKHITQEIKFKSEDVVKFKRKKSEADIEIGNIIKQCDQLKAKMPASKKMLQQQTKELQLMRAELSKFDKPQLKQKIKQCEVQLSKNELDLNTIRNKLESVKQNLQKMKSGKDQLQSKIADYRAKLASDTQIMEKISKAYRIAQKIVKEKKEIVYGLNEKRQQVRNQLKKCQNQLREELNTTEQKGQMGNMFRQIMQQGFPGVIGRLGDLGEVPRQFDEIITTCCSRLDNIVCTDLETARAVLDFLKKRKLGRVTCIILQKIGQHRNYMNKPFEVLPRATRLFDVIKFKTQQAKLAFYFALSDTLYCEDSDLGLQYSMKNQHQRRRVISKNKNRSGYIIYEMNGLMVGSMARRGGFDLKAGIKNKKTKDEGHLRQMQEKKRILAAQSDELNKKIQLEEENIKKANLDIEQMKRETASIESNIKEYEQQIKDLSQMIAKSQGKTNSNHLLQRQVQALTQAQSSLAKKKAQFQKQLQKYEAQQRRNQTPQINALRQKYKIQRTEAARLQKQSERQKAQIETGLKRINDLKKQKVQNDKMLERAQKQIDNLKNHQLQLESQTSDILGKMAAVDQKIKERKKIEAELKNVSDDEEKQLKESRMKVEKVKKDVENCMQNCKKQNQDLKFAESQLQRMRQNYKELSSTYTFFQQLDQIEKMNIGGDKNFVNQHNQALHSSILQSSMLNSSIDANQPKVFPLQQLLKTEPLQNLSEDQLEIFSYFKDRLSGMITTQTAALKKIEGSNLQIINQFKSKYSHYRERLGQFEAVRERQVQLKRIIDHLKEQRLRMFREGFGIINAKLKQVYQHLTRGGDAQLQLIDSLDPFSDGVNFSVRPPKKSWKEVNKLSGGQKTLSSLSLIFALHYYKPTPLYFMDQIDAALDFKNVSIVADYIKKRTKDAQFIIISLRNNMFDLADKLIGVYKTFDKTKVINLQPAKLLKAKQQKQKQNMEAKANQPFSAI